MTLITTTSELALACQRFSRHPFVTVDTEFLRETTFWPVLCVVQVASSDEALAIDALAPGLDLAPLIALMADSNVVKVFHAAPARRRNFLEARRAGAEPDVRHPGRGDGLRLRRPGFLQRTGAIDLPGGGRQVVALHRLGAPPARSGADRLCHRRRHAFARHLSRAAGATGEIGPPELAGGRNEGPHLGRDLRTAPRARLGALQDAREEAARSRRLDGSRRLAGKRGSDPRRAARARPQGRRAGRSRARRAAHPGGARQPARVPARHGALARRRRNPRRHRTRPRARPQDAAQARRASGATAPARRRPSNSSRCCCARRARKAASPAR